MSPFGAVLLAALELVADGEAKASVATDGSPPAVHAADLVRRHAVLISGAALPAGGLAATLRFERGEAPGYEIALRDGGATVRGADLVRAAYDLLETWGCRFDGPEPVVPRRATLRVEARTWRPARALWLDRFDETRPLTGVAVHGLLRYRPEALARARALGYGVRVASETFDDFLPPALLTDHPEWFALRQETREARGNFALLNAEARGAYLERLGLWLAAHPDVDVVGIWPEVTQVWDEAALAHGAAASYALLWREAAERFPARRFEILATGLTLRPPAGPVPANVEVRLRPGRDASALQGKAGQEIGVVVRAWEARGAAVVLEIDAAPPSMCGMFWPCHEAVAADARRFRAAVLRRGEAVHARIWRTPAVPLRFPERLADAVRRARSVRSWGHPADAADLFRDDATRAEGLAGMAERARRTATADALPLEERRAAARRAYLGYRNVLAVLEPGARRTWERYRRRAYARMVRELLPDGVAYEVGPARVVDALDRVTVETERLRFVIARDTAAVVGLQRRLGKEWSRDLAGGEGGRLFAVVGLAVTAAERTGGEVEVSSPATGRVRIGLRGRLARGGPAWTSTLAFSNAGSLVRQTAWVDAEAGGIATGCRWPEPVFDRWVCPPWAAEGRLPGGAPRRGLFLPKGTLVYLRDGERGVGLAARVPEGGTASLVEDGQTTFVLTSRSQRLTVDWILFTHPTELAHR